jgi:hypothetical protein
LGCLGKQVVHGIEQSGKLFGEPSPRARRRVRLGVQGLVCVFASTVALLRSLSLDPMTPHLPLLSFDDRSSIVVEARECPRSLKGP